MLELNKIRRQDPIEPTRDANTSPPDEVESIFARLKSMINGLENTNQESAKQFLDLFSSVPQKETKILLAQRLFSALYDNQAERYFFAPSLLANLYPKLKEYINFRDSSYERVLTPQGILFAIDLWEKAGKLSTAVKSISCPNIEDFRKNIEELHNSSHDLSKIFLLQMGNSIEEAGDHTIPIFIKKSGSQIRVIITDSPGISKLFFDSVAKLIYSLMPNADISCFAIPRQRNLHSCLMFAMHDASVIGKDPDAFVSFVDSQSEEPIADAPYKLFYALPDPMMKGSQVLVSKREIQEVASHTDNRTIGEVTSQFMRVAHARNRDNEVGLSNDEVDEWKRKGLMLTPPQYSKTQNIKVNKTFSKIEAAILRGILE